MNLLSSRFLLAGGLIAFVVHASGRAEAQTATPLDRYDPTPAGDPLFAVPSAEARGRLVPSGGLVLSYAHAPLVVTGEVGGERKPVANVVASQWTLHALASLNIVERLKVDLDVPATPSQKGESVTLATGVAKAPSGGALNDIRLGVRGEVARARAASFALSLTAWLPTGDDKNYTSAGKVRVAPALVLGGASRRFVWSTMVGAHLQSEATTHESLLGSDLFAGLGAAYRAGPVQIGAEFFGSTVTSETIRAFSTTRSSLEALFGVRVRTGPLVWGGAVAGGVAAGIGTPNYRFILSAAFAPEVPGAQVYEGEPEPPAFVPPARTFAVAPKTTSSPPIEDKPAILDSDSDGIPDGEDKCPKEAGVAQSDPAKNGCPLAGKGKGPGIDYRGCPLPVDPAGVQAELLDNVQFDKKRNALRADALPILRKVAAVMKSHPEIAVLLIDGHTDDVGSESVNLPLAKQRAEVVHRWLVEHGVSAKRLEVRAFALYCPRADDFTDNGRQGNRRVEFRIKK